MAPNNLSHTFSYIYAYLADGPAGICVARDMEALALAFQREGHVIHTDSWTANDSL